MCAAARMVWEWWVVKGAPKRKRRKVMRKVKRVVVRRREREMGYIDMS